MHTTSSLLSSSSSSRPAAFVAAFEDYSRMPPDDKWPPTLTERSWSAGLWRVPCGVFWAIPHHLKNTCHWARPKSVSGVHRFSYGANEQLLTNTAGSQTASHRRTLFANISQLGAHILLSCCTRSTGAESLPACARITFSKYGSSKLHFDTCCSA